MKILKNVDWPYMDYDAAPAMDENKCKKWCEDDCLCRAVLFVFVSPDCWKKKYPLAFGMESNNRTAFIKLWRNDNSTENSVVVERSKGVNHLHIVMISLLSLAFLVFLSYCYYQRRKSSRFITHGKEYEGKLHHFSYEALRLFTNGFSHELGHGSFGTVYKGKMTSNCQTETRIAVKKLNRGNKTDGDEKEFKTEVNVIGQTHHKNLVKLVGYCDEREHRILVYEFMSNGCLSSCLFGATKPCWPQQVKIAIEIARGLSYLHEGCNNPIIHCDIKPQNILLDHDLTAKVSDFGLAKLLNTNQSKTCTGIRGTRGYVAPEWFRNVNVTVKVDVYSFGVMLLEIISCRRSIEPSLEEKGEAILADWAYECYQEGGTNKLLVDNDERDGKTLKQLVMVAIWCVQEEASSRPSMREVALMLEEVIEVPRPPNILDTSVVDDLNP